MLLEPGSRELQGIDHFRCDRSRRTGEALKRSGSLLRRAFDQQIGLVLRNRPELVVIVLTHREKRTYDVTERCGFRHFCPLNSHHIGMCRRYWRTAERSISNKGVFCRYELSLLNGRK